MTKKEVAIDPKYFLGKLCALQHEFESTGKCLREITGRHRCKICRELGIRIVDGLGEKIRSSRDFTGLGEEE